MEKISELFSGAGAAMKKAAAEIRSDADAAIKSLDADFAGLYNRANAILEDTKIGKGEQELVDTFKGMLKNMRGTFAGASKEEVEENKPEVALSPNYPVAPTGTALSPNIKSAFLPMGEGAGDIPAEAALQSGMPHKVVNTAPPGTEAYARAEQKISAMRGESKEDVQKAYDENAPDTTIKPDPQNRLVDHYSGLSPNTDAASSQVNPNGAPTMVVGSMGQRSAQADGLMLQPTETGTENVPEGSTLADEELKARLQVINNDSTMSDEEKESARELAKKVVEPKEKPEPVLTDSDKLPPTSGSGATESTKENVEKTEGIEGEMIAEAEGLRGPGGESARNANTESEKGPFDSTGM